MNHERDPVPGERVLTTRAGRGKLIVNIMETNDSIIGRGRATPCSYLLMWRISSRTGIGAGVVEAALCCTTPLGVTQY